MLAKQRNKLIGIGIFLVLVAFAIGGEDDPGLIPALAKQDVDEPRRLAEPPAAAAPVHENSNDTAALKNWYSGGPAAQEPTSAEPTNTASPSTPSPSVSTPSAAKPPANSDGQVDTVYSPGHREVL